MIHGPQPDAPPCAQLPEAPEVGADHLGERDEAAETGTVDADDDRHVAGEHDRPDAVGAVEHVRRVQTGRAAVAPSPPRLRPDEADPGPIRVVVHEPVAVEQLQQPSLGDEVRRPVRPERHAQSVLTGQLGIRERLGQRRCRRQPRQRQAVPAAQRPAAESGGDKRRA